MSDAPINVSESFEDRVKKAKLTKSGREIARYLLDNFFKVSCMTATNIAKELNISDVTVIRFARSLGYEGYNDMQKELQKRMVDYTQTLLAYPASVLEFNMENEGNSSTVELACNNELKNLNKFIERNNDKLFIEIARIICNSRRKVVMGVRGSAASAFSFAMRLRYLVDDVFHVIYADPNDSYPLYTLGEPDCLIVFGSVNYPQATIDAVELANSRNAKVIAFTDSEASPLAKAATLSVICSVNGISFSSYTMPLLASEIVAANIAREIGDKAELRNQALADNMQKRHYFSTLHSY